MNTLSCRDELKSILRLRAARFLPHTPCHTPCHTSCLSATVQGKVQLQKMRAYVEAHAADGCTFAPTVTKKAAALHRPGSAAERLYNPDWVRARKAEERK